MNDTQRKIQDSKNIDFSKWMSTDDLSEIQDNLKGLQVIQYSLTDAQRGGGGYENIDLAYDLVGQIIGNIVSDIEALKPKIDYVDSFGRVGTDELIKR